MREEKGERGKKGGGGEQSADKLPIFDLKC